MSLIAYTSVAFLLFIIRFELTNDHQGTAETCQEAIKYFESNQHLSSPNAVLNFKQKMLTAYIQLKKYKLAEQTATECLAIVSSGSHNWFLTLRYHLITLLHSQQFQAAYPIYQKAVSHPKYTQLSEREAERWRIYEAFIHYLISIDKITVTSEEPIKRFRLSKFLNELPINSKDKQGVNISILILQILFLLQQKKYNNIIDQMEPLKIYNHRYLRQDETFRSNCFLKMVLQLPQANFHKEAVIRKSKKYHKRLVETSHNLKGYSILMEVFPYEMLWEFVLESLDEKFH